MLDRHMWVGTIVEGEIGRTLMMQVYEGAELPLRRCTQVSTLGDYEKNFQTCTIPQLNDGKLRETIQGPSSWGETNTRSGVKYEQNNHFCCIHNAWRKKSIHNAGASKGNPPTPPTEPESESEPLYIPSVRSINTLNSPTLAMTQRRKGRQKI